MVNLLSYILRLITEHIYTGIGIDSQNGHAIIKYSSKDSFTLSEYEVSSLPINQQIKMLNSLLALNHDFTSEKNFFEKNIFSMGLLLSVTSIAYLFKDRIMSFICPHRIQPSAEIELRSQRRHSMIQDISSLSGNDSGTGRRRSIRQARRYTNNLVMPQSDM